MEFPAPEKSIVAESHQSDDKLIEDLEIGERKENGTIIGSVTGMEALVYQLIPKKTMYFLQILK